jgi:tetratricopeptide (TPR) repeat protein
MLEEALGFATRGEGALMLVAGDAGMGKTRLCTQLALWARQRGTAELWGGCSPADLALPYLPFVEAIGDRLVGPRGEALRKRLGPRVRPLAALFPQLQIETEELPSVEVAEGRVRLFETVLTTLGIIAADGGALLVLDDVQWADSSSLSLIDFLHRRIRSVPLLVVATYRGDELHRRHPLLPLLQSWGRAGVETIQLASLAPDAIGAMVSAIFEDPTRSDTRDYLYRRCDGNPFVLEELLKAALDHGDIFRTAEGRWERRALGDIRLPETVRDMILPRLEQFEAGQVEVLRAASVLGPSFEGSALYAISGAEEAVVHDTLRIGVQHQLLEEMAGGTGRYRFRHALTKEAIYDDMVTARRRRLHARAADAVAAMPGPSDIDVCHHLLEAGLWDRAVPVCSRAALSAFRALAFEDAASLYERVLSHQTEPVERGHTLCRLGETLYHAGRNSAARENLEEGIAILGSAGLVADAAHHRLTLGECFEVANDPGRANIERSRAIDALTPLGPSEDLALAHVRLAARHVFELEGEAAESAARKAIAVADAVGADLPRIWAYTYLGNGLADQGQIAEGLAWMDRSWEEAIARGYPAVASNGLLDAIVTREWAGRFAEIAPLLERFLGLAAGRRWEIAAREWQGFFWRWTGSLGAAARRFEELLELARELGLARTEGELLCGLAPTYSLLGDLERARKHLPRPVDFPERQHLAMLLFAHLQVALDAGDGETGLELARRVPELQRFPLFWRRVLGDRAVALLLRTGALGEAQAIAELTRVPGSDDPIQQRIDGRLARARGDLLEARQRLESSVAGLGPTLLRPEAVISRELLADMLVEAGDLAAATEQLRAVAHLARECEMSAYEARAREGLKRLGVASGGAESTGADADRETLKELLDSLDRAPRAEREQVLAAMRRLAASGKPREAESGELLLDYYVRHAGSHEVIAERLHLSRPTFYRRLDRGLARLSEVLRDAAPEVLRRPVRRSETDPGTVPAGN